jgi:hypothetical protein
LLGISVQFLDEQSTWQIVFSSYYFPLSFAPGLGLLSHPVSIGQATLFLDGVQQVDEVELTLERAIRA